VRARDKLRLRLRSLFFRRHVDRELETELQFHLEQLTEETVTDGTPPDEARRLALLKMGNVTQFQEECRDMRRVNFVDDLLRDLQYAGRNLRRSPGFATLAILIMALGIGANTAVFSVVNAVLLKPLAYRDADRIVALTNSSSTRETPTALSKQVSIPDVQDWRGQSASFEAMAWYASSESAVMQGSTAEYARVASVSPEFFRVFAVEPLAGRAFTPEETRQGAAGAAMISYPYWQSHFGGDPHALGQIVRTPTPLSIVGVLPPGFRFPDLSGQSLPVIWVG